MQLFGIRSAVSRQMVAALGVAAVIGTSSLHAQQPQQPAPAAPAAQAPAPPDPMKFNAGSPAAILYIVKSDKVADFDLFWSTVRSKVNGGTNQELKDQLAGLKIFKIPGDPSKPTDPQNYLFYIDAASARSYSPTELLYNSGGLFERAEADQMFAKLKDALMNILAWPLSKVS
jgi:hypothetical protein